MASLGAQRNTVAEGSIKGAQCDLYGSEPFYGVIMPLDFQEARWRVLFLADGGGVDLFGGSQVSLY